MNTERDPQGAPDRVTPSRADRGSKRRQRRSIVVVVAVVVLLAAGTFVVTRGGDSDSSPGGATSASTPDPPGAMMAFQVRGTAAPMLAVLGAASETRAPAAMPLPADLTIIVPGQGETAVTSVAALPGPSMRTALSNMSGAWLSSYAVLSLKELGSMVDGIGGLRVTLTEAYTSPAGVVGPGAISMTGPQTKAFLAGATDDAGARWEIVLKALLADPPPLTAADSDDAEAAAEVFASVAGAEIVDIPTDVVAGTLRVPIYPELDGVMAEAFGTSTPTPAIVQNGNGAPGVGEAVGQRIIPAGFRIVISQNAQTFDVEVTDIFANGVDHEGDARVAHRALGVGRVQVSQVPSGIGDVTIVVGKDFQVAPGGTG
jgi:hypothetical protein